MPCTKTRQRKVPCTKRQRLLSFQDITLVAPLCIFILSVTQLTVSRSEYAKQAAAAPPAAKDFNRTNLISHAMIGTPRGEPTNQELYLDYAAKKNARAVR